MYSGALGSDSLGFNVYSTVVAKVGEFQSESPNTTKVILLFSNNFSSYRRLENGSGQN